MHYILAIYWNASYEYITFHYCISIAETVQKVTSTQIVHVSIYAICSSRTDLFIETKMTRSNLHNCLYQMECGMEIEVNAFGSLCRIRCDTCFGLVTQNSNCSHFWPLTVCDKNRYQNIHWKISTKRGIWLWFAAPHEIQIVLCVFWIRLARSRAMDFFLFFLFIEYLLIVFSVYSTYVFLISVQRPSLLIHVQCVHKNNNNLNTRCWRTISGITLLLNGLLQTHIYFIYLFVSICYSLCEK